MGTGSFSSFLAIEVQLAVISQPFDLLFDAGLSKKYPSDCYLPCDYSCSPHIKY